MRLTALALVGCLILAAGCANGQGTGGGGNRETAARVATLDPADIEDFASQPPVIRELLKKALELTKLNLAYRYGSSDPSAGGMDCSGTICYLLKSIGMPDPPRDSSEIYRWAWMKGRFQAVVSSDANSFEFSRLKPGDLLFWSGTYHVVRDPPVTHVMIYLGINRQTGRRVMIGASEGRRFDGISRYGVSVFDLELPQPVGAEDASSNKPRVRFIGYCSIPGLEAMDKVGSSSAK